MKVSVCVPLFNLAATVERTIKSVLEQTLQDFEIVLVDDGSTDDGAQLAKALAGDRVTVIRTENKGIASALNTAIEHATGEFVTALAADDTIEPEYLAEAVALLESDAELGAATCHARYMDGEGKEIERPGYFSTPKNCSVEEWKRVLFHAGNSGFGIVTYRKQAMEKAGQFDGSYRQLLDLEYYLRLLDCSYKLGVIEKPLSRFRVHAGQTSEPTEENGRQHVIQLDRIRHKYFFKKTKIMIATPFYENKGYSPYIRSMFQTVYMLARHSTLDFDFQEVSGGSYIDHNRNMIANSFLDSDATHLLFLDSDQSWDVQGFLNLIKADVDVVGAAYPVKNNWEQYGVTIHVDDDGRPIVNENGLILADKVPTGFMKIHRRVFEKLRAAHPDDWYFHGKDQRLYNFFGHLTINHVRYGEDISFGIRWQGIGGKIWLEPRVSMGHYGVQGWYGNYHDYLQKQPGGSQSTEPLPKAA